MYFSSQAVSPYLSGYGFRDNQIQGAMAFAATPPLPGLPVCNPNLNSTAQAIIAAAQDTTVPLQTRGLQNVRNLLNTYYPSEAGKVSGLRWNEPQSGLLTTSVGAGPSATGIITVGRYFTEQTRSPHFARRVLQLGHELRHIDQYRAGMTGPAKKAEREFLAHSWTALTSPRAGTGCVPNGTLVRIIDCALAYRNCMPAAAQARYATEGQRLLALRSQLSPATPWPPAGGMPACPPPNC